MQANSYQKLADTRSFLEITRMSNQCERSNYDQQLKQRILDHCAWIATFDRDYAIWTFRNYCTELDWLGLRDKRTETYSGSAQSSGKVTEGGRH
jgi:hypothetical protein